MDNINTTVQAGALRCLNSTAYQYTFVKLTEKWGLQPTRYTREVRGSEMINAVGNLIDGISAAPYFRAQVCEN